MSFSSSNGDDLLFVVDHQPSYIISHITHTTEMCYTTYTDVLLEQQKQKQQQRGESSGLSSCYSTASQLASPRESGKQRLLSGLAVVANLKKQALSFARVLAAATHPHSSTSRCLELFS